MIHRLKPEEVKNIINNEKNVKIIDVREEWENHIANIKNSDLMPLSKFIETSKSLNKKDKTIVYCHLGIRSLQVCYYLEKLGFNDLINLEGGIDAWAKEIDNSIPVY